MDCFYQISINGQIHNVGTVVRVNNHYMVGIVLGILAALVAGAVLAFMVMKHQRKKKKGGLLSVVALQVLPAMGGNFTVLLYVFFSLHDREPFDSQCQSH